MAICRFHRRGNAIWVKVFGIGCSICNLRNKSAAKFCFGQNGVKVRKGETALSACRSFPFPMTYPFLGKLMFLFKEHTAFRHKVQQYFKLRCLAVGKRHFADFIGEVVQLWLKFLTFLLQSAICRFHRRDNATLVKAFNIGYSICNSPCKPATKFRFRFKAYHLTVPEQR